MQRRFHCTSILSSGAEVFHPWVLWEKPGSGFEDSEICNQLFATVNRSVEISNVFRARLLRNPKSRVSCIENDNVLCISQDVYLATCLAANVWTQLNQHRFKSK